MDIFINNQGYIRGVYNATLAFNVENLINEQDGFAIVSVKNHKLLA